METLTSEIAQTEFDSKDEQQESPEKTKNFARAVVLSPDGDVLMVRRKSGSFEEGQYELPGGKLDPDEDFDTALLRELSEETGINAALIPNGAEGTALLSQLRVDEGVNAVLIDQLPIVSDRPMEAFGNAHDGKTAHTETKVIMADTIELDRQKLLTEHTDAMWCSKEDLIYMYEQGELSKTTLDTVNKALTSITELPPES